MAIAPISGSGPLITTNALLAKMYPKLYTLYPNTPVVEVKKDSNLKTVTTKVVDVVKDFHNTYAPGGGDSTQKAVDFGNGAKVVIDTVSGNNGLMVFGAIGLGLVLVVGLLGGRR